MTKKSAIARRISNRRARYDYDLGDSLIVGLQLTGAETKALRLGHGSLRGAYVTIKDSELWLINAQIMGGVGLPITEADQIRNRKLLAKRSEVEKLITVKGQGQAIVPLEILNQGRYIKLRIAVGRGKKHRDKREKIKRRQASRDIARESKA